MSWFTRTFKPTPPRPTRTVEVGKAHVTVITFDNVEYVLDFVGEYLGVHPLAWAGKRTGVEYDDWIHSAEFFADKWQQDNGARGTVYVGPGEYVGLADIKRIKIEHTSHRVEAT